MNTIIDPSNNQSYNLFSNKGKQLLKQYVKNFYGGMKLGKLIIPKRLERIFVPNVSNTPREFETGEELKFVKIDSEEMEECKKDCKNFFLEFTDDLQVINDNCDPYITEGEYFNWLQDCYDEKIQTKNQTKKMLIASSN